MIGGAAAAAAVVVGGILALSNARASATRPGPDSCDDTTDPGEVHADEQPSPAAIGLALVTSFVDEYLRNTCLNTRGHATGDCTHEVRPVASHTKGPGREQLKSDESANV
ncbi:hypothetical protein [Streptomyces meridianus]|uniref:Uncharacterized protein n=1 Tax=Streptomyces meridianus TaxID=2938945 RepID=A0ABT0X864_9ACTN|nr:hypothetical protein [Streptomyces meridianus]MCM2578713.1 hypothetical protein [Streptomyces meridianus]